MSKYVNPNKDCSSCAPLFDAVEQLTDMTQKLGHRMDASDKVTQDLTTKMKLFLFLGGIACTTIGSAITDIIKGVLTR